MLKATIRGKIAFFLSITLFRLILDISYIQYVNPVFSYSGFNLDINILSYIISWILYIASCFIAKKTINKISDYFAITALLGLIAPLTSMYGLDSSRPIIPVIISITSVFLVKIISDSTLIPSIRIPHFKNSRNIIVNMSVFFVLSLVTWYIYTGAVMNMNFDLIKVYDFREDNAKLTSGKILSYLNNWTYQVFNIFLLAFFLYRKKYGIVLLFIAIQFLFFGVTNHKSIIFYPLLIIGIWFYFKKSKLSISFPITFSTIISFSLFYYLAYENTEIPSMFIRRVFFIPADLTFSYFEFFSTNKNIFWSNSILSGIIDYPYGELSLARTIGEYRGTGYGDNNGYISSGFAHAGFFGVIFYSFILGYILKILDSLSKSGIPLWFSLGLVAVPLRSVILSSDLFVALLTHGLIVVITLLILFRSKNKNT